MAILAITFLALTSTPCANGQNIWVATGSTNAVRYAYTATLLPDGKVPVAGGFGVSGFLSSAGLYDPATGAWTATGAMNTARGSHTATLVVSTYTT